MSQAMKNFGRNLYIALYDKKLSQSELSDKIGISQKTISNYINGYKSPSTASLIKIAEVLGVTVDSLIQ